MSESRRKKDLSAALALLVLTGSAVTSIPAFAEDPQAQADAAQVQKADDILATVNPSTDSPDETQRKIEEARNLLRQATSPGRNVAERPTCG